MRRGMHEVSSLLRPEWMLSPAMPDYVVPNRFGLLRCILLQAG